MAPGEPPLPSTDSVPTDAPAVLPFDITWQGALAAVGVLAVLTLFYLALRPEDPLDTANDPVPVNLPDDHARVWPVMQFGEMLVDLDRLEEEQKRVLPPGRAPTVPIPRGRVAGLGALEEEKTTKIGRHRAFEAPRYIRSHRRPAPVLRGMAYAGGFIFMCGVAVLVGIAIVALLEG